METLFSYTIAQNKLAYNRPFIHEKSTPSQRRLFRVYGAQVRSNTVGLPLLLTRLKTDSDGELSRLFGESSRFVTFCTLDKGVVFRYPLSAR